MEEKVRLTDIIIPIYADFKKTKDCLTSVIKYSNSGQRIILINDKSPDENITKYLKLLIKKNKDILLIEHKRNKGFVRSVNEGMSLSSENDVILLNSDTIVTPNWVEKLGSTAKKDPYIATVTPMSNSATICSYPKFLHFNNLIDDLSPIELNELFEEAAKGLSGQVTLPTAVGFCMYITREALNNVGLFDEKTFGKGYGEENDFCVRATMAGYKNIVCSNTFIYHAEGASFGQSKKKRVEVAIDLLKQKQPRYMGSVQDFIRSDSLIVLRRRVDVLRFIKHTKPALLSISHHWGGGIYRHVNEITHECHKQGWRHFIIEPYSSGVKLKSGEIAESFELVFTGFGWYEDLLVVLKVLSINHIHLHSWVGHSDEIFDIAKDLGLKMDFTVHDFLSVCPRINFLNLSNAFCGATLKERDCNKCLDLEDGIGNFRKKTYGILKECRKIFAPSTSAADYLNKYFPDLEIVVIPHNEQGYEEYKAIKFKPSNIKNKGHITVATIGAIGPHKGSNVIQECVWQIDKKGLPIKWVIIGQLAEKKVSSSSMTVIGPYGSKKELLHLINKLEVDVIVLPVICPETYSYTLSEAWQSGRPVIAPDLGALGERIKGIGAGWLVSAQMGVDDICNTILSLYYNPGEIEKKALAINKYSPVSEFHWDDYYGDLPIRDNIIGAEKEKAIDLVSKIALQSLYEVNSQKEIIEQKNRWINHLERDILYLNREIRKYRKRIEDHKTIMRASAIMNKVLHKVKVGVR